MIKILNLLDEKLKLPQLNENLYRIATSQDDTCDVVLCGFDSVEYAGAIANPLESLFVVTLDNPAQQKHLVPNIFSAWIDSKQLDKFPKMLDAYQVHIEHKMKLKEQREIIERMKVDISVHSNNLDGIKESMRESAKEIESIFEERVEEMREIHRDAIKTHEELSILKEQIAPQEFKHLENSWTNTASILSRTDEVIQAMFGFIIVLQCEDRITQMIDGIVKIMADDLEFVSTNGFTISQEDEKILKERLVPFYTIQEQRDYAQGIDNALQGCKPDQEEIEEFLLF